MQSYVHVSPEPFKKPTAWGWRVVETAKKRRHEATLHEVGGEWGAGGLEGGVSTDDG